MENWKCIRGLDVGVKRDYFRWKENRKTKAVEHSSQTPCDLHHSCKPDAPVHWECKTAMLTVFYFFLSFSRMREHKACPGSETFLFHILLIYCIFRDCVYVADYTVSDDRRWWFGRDDWKNTCNLVYCIITELICRDKRKLYNLKYGSRFVGRV
jgi:hypothetical protein